MNDLLIQPAEAPLRIVGTENDPANLRPESRTGAHHTGLHSYVKCAIYQVFTAKIVCCCCKRLHFGVCGYVVQALGKVVAAANDLSLANHYCTYWDLICRQREPGFLQRFVHEEIVGSNGIIVGKVNVAHDGAKIRKGEGQKDKGQKIGYTKHPIFCLWSFVLPLFPTFAHASG